jgi:Mg-chelatase subunit ChlD
MTPTNPWVMWLALAALPVVAAFLIRRFRRQRNVSSVEIYRRMLAGQVTKRRFAAPQHILALLLTLLALFALVGAALDLRSVEEPPRHAILVVDTSASMATTEAEATEPRLVRAQRAVRGYLEALRPQDRVAVIAAGAEAHLGVGWTSDGASVAGFVDGLSTGGDGRGIQDALRIADAMCQDPANTEVILVSDGAGLDLSRPRCPLRYVRVGEDAPNLAVTGLSVREADALGLNEVYLAVHNGSDEARTYHVNLAVDGRIADVVEGRLEPHSTSEQLLRLPLRDGERLSATLSPGGPDAMALDDVGWAAMRSGGSVQTLLVTRHPTTFLAEALRLHPRVSLTVRRPDELAELVEPFDLVVTDTVVNGALPPADHVVVLDAELPWLNLEYSGLVREPEVIRWEFEHPLFRFVRLDGVHILGARAATLPEGALALAEMPDGPLIFEMQAEGREVLVFTFHPDRSDLPLRVAFVNLVANLVEWAQPGDATSVASTVSVGSRLAGAPPGATLTSLEAGATPFAASEVVERPGVYRLEDADGVQRTLVAANLFSAAEAELSAQTRLGVGAMYGFPEAAPPAGFPWWILALAAGAMLLLEWALPALLGASQRRRRVKPVAKVAPGRAATMVRTVVMGDPSLVAPGEGRDR